MAYALQLHQEREYNSSSLKDDRKVEMTFTDREIRRRTMWSCFLMDQFHSSGTERPTFSNEENIAVQLPIREALFQMDLPGSTERLDGGESRMVRPVEGLSPNNIRSNMGVAAYMIRIIALWGQVIRYLNLGGQERDPHPIWSINSQFALLRSKLDTFAASLPTSLDYTAENLKNHSAERLANQFLLMHICHQQVVLFMHRFAIPWSSGQSVEGMPDSFLSSACALAVDAAKQISALISVAEDYRVVAPFAGYCAFVSSTVHVWGLFSKDAKLEASSKRDLAHNVKYLSRTKKYWGMFHFMTESLKDIYRQHADAASKGPTSERASTYDAGIFQYGDWFMKYPHGVSRIDHEDPAVVIKKESANDAVLNQTSNLQSVEAFFASTSLPLQSQLQRKAAKIKTKTVPNIPNKEQILLSKHHSTEVSPKVIHQQPVLPTSSSNQTPAMITNRSHPQPPQLYQQQRYFLPPSRYGPSGIVPSHHSQNMLPHVDQPLVYGAYAGLDCSPVGNTLPNSMNHYPAWGDVNMTGMSSVYPQDPTSAWFAPFNMQPPGISGESPFPGGIHNVYHMHPPPLPPPPPP